MRFEKLHASIAFMQGSLRSSKWPNCCLFMTKVSKEIVLKFLNNILIQFPTANLNKRFAFWKELCNVK